MALPVTSSSILSCNVTNCGKGKASTREHGQDSAIIFREEKSLVGAAVSSRQATATNVKSKTISVQNVLEKGNINGVQDST